LIARHNLRGFARHRAMGDVDATAAFVDYATADLGVVAVTAALKTLLKTPSLPANLPTDVLTSIPDTAGVYLFYGVNDLPLYIGKAKHLRERVRSHFSSDHTTANDIRLSQELRRIEWISTAGEFSALLLEAQLVKERFPLHNVALRRRAKSGFLMVNVDDTSPAWIEASAIDAHTTETAPRYFGPFSDKASAKKWIGQITKEHQLCEHLLGISKPRLENDPCFARQIGRCFGVCTGLETAAQHRARLSEALATKAYPAWPYERSVVFTERDEANDQTDLLIFDQWCAVSGGTRLPFDADVYKLLQRMIKLYPDRFVEYPA
jgi:DNA polymerase III subunit epsilon